jgi:hypothetical protein
MRSPVTPVGSSDASSEAPVAGSYAAAWLVASIGIAAATACVLTRAAPIALGGDNETLHHPLFIDALRQMAAGDLPVWTTGRWGGSPLIGDPVLGAMHPLNYVGYVLTTFPHARAIDVAACLHMAVLVLGVVWLMRGLGIGPCVAVATAALVALDPTLVYVARGWINWYGTIACWPWLLGATLRLARTPRLDAALVATVALAAQIYAGYPQFALYFGLVALGAMVVARGPGRAQRLGLVVAIGVGACALAAPQLLPGLGLARDSMRLAPGGVDRLAALDVIAIPAARWPRVLTATPDLPTMPCKLGLLAVALAGLGTFGGRAFAGYLAVAALVTAALATGPNPVHPMLHMLPVFSFFGGPLKFFYVTAFLVPVLAGLGLDAIVTRWRRGGRALVAALGLAAAPAAGIMGVAAGMLGALLPRSLTGVAAIVVALVGSTALLVRTDALRAPQPFSRDAFTPLLRRQATDFAPEPHPGRWIAIDGERPLQQVGMNFGARWGIASWSGVGPLPPSRSYAALESAELAAAAPLVRMLAATHVVVRAGGSVERRLLEGGFRATGLADGLRVLVPPEVPAPRFVLVPRAAPATTEEAVAAARRGTALGPDGVLVEAMSAADDLDGDPSGTLTVVDGGPVASRLAVAVDRPTWLVARDPYYGRWTATIDGAPAAVHPAGGIFLAVRVPAGRHEVQLRYDDPGLRIGTIVALVAMLVATPVFARLTRRSGA